MREIKFRAWLAETKKIVYFDLWGLDGNYIISADEMFDEDDGDVVMQYTGLKDKNGREIYEGDIVKDNCGHWDKKEVEISPQFFHEAIEYGLLRGLLSGKPVLEIIGNIYENPELIEKESS